MGGPCFEQLGENPSPSDRELKELDNFHVSPFILDGKQWPTTEHFFQAAKFSDNPEYQEEIRNAPTCMGPAGCFLLGRNGMGLRSDWNLIKVEVMYRANKAKFEQHAHLSSVLTSCGGLIRAQGNRDEWATWNEIILERIREELRGGAISSEKKEEEGAEEDKGEEGAGVSEAAAGDSRNVLASRTAIMSAYRKLMQMCQLSPKSFWIGRATIALARHAAMREVPPWACNPMLCEEEEEEGGVRTPLASYVVAGFGDASGDAPWVNGVYFLDPLEPTVNGQPHLITGTTDENAHGHMYVGTRRGVSQWVIDEGLDRTQTGGMLTLPTTTPPDAAATAVLDGGTKAVASAAASSSSATAGGAAGGLPLGVHQWVFCGRVAAELVVSLIGETAGSNSSTRTETRAGSHVTTVVTSAA